MSETLTANQRYKLANTSLSFADWIEREKAKGAFIKNQALEDLIKPYKAQNVKTAKAPKNESAFSTGVPKWVIGGGIALVVGALVYKYYN